MTEQVNRLIANRLAAGCELFLPGVGSLYVEQRGARRLDDERVVPPCRAVNFTTQEQGVSLIDEIVRAAHCDHEKAQSIYDRWLDSVVGERTLTISGVGELKGNRFNSDPEFEMVLNPYGFDPVRIREKRGDCALWIALLAVVSALAIGYFAFFAERIELPEPVRRVLGIRSAPAVETVPEEAVPVSCLCRPIRCRPLPTLPSRRIPRHGSGNPDPAPRIRCDRPSACTACGGRAYFHTHSGYCGDGSQGTAGNGWKIYPLMIEFLPYLLITGNQISSKGVFIMKNT